MTSTVSRSEERRAGAFQPGLEAAGRKLSVALLGAPYVGKGTLFDLMTGFSQHSLRWPGTSVDLRAGRYQCGPHTLEIIDLPAVYSLTANTPDELVAREYILGEKPEVVVVVVSAASLERTLYLVAEAMELPSRVVVAVNMMDVASRSGIRIEAEVLQAALGVPVVATVAARGEGLAQLAETALDLAEGRLPYAPKRPELDPRCQELIYQVGAALGEGEAAKSGRWRILKLLEGDREITRRVQEGLPATRWSTLHSLLRDNEDAVVSIASARYGWIERMVRAAVVRPRRGAVSLTESLDRVATHPVLGTLLLLALLVLLFWLVYEVARPAVALLDRSVAALGELLRASLAGLPSWVAGLLVDGVLDGVGTVLSLLPFLVVFFLGMSLLQQVGYLSRAAFVADRFMHLMGLHGQSLLPLFLGFGCNVPAVLGSRLIDTARGRLLTVLLIPLVPCTGRVAVLVFVAAALLGSAAPLVTWGLVVGNLALLAVVGMFLSRVVLPGEQPALIMELPLYHLPNGRVTVLQTWQNIREFLVRAGTVILLVSILIWWLADQPNGRIQESYLAQAGRHLEPLGNLMGLDWRMMVALLTSFVAKENALATMAILAGSEQGGLAVALPQMLTPASAMAYLVLQITFVPCISTLSAIHHQTGGWRWVAFTVGYLLVLSVLAGVATYKVAQMLGWGSY